MQPTPPEGDHAPDPPPGIGWRPWYMLALLVLAYLLSSIGRFVINVLVEPIKHDLALSDTRVAILLGFAFSLSYVVVTVPFGFLADKISRRNLIVGGIACWSAACMASGLANSYAELFVFRLVLAIGEAVLLPAAFSLLRDLFGPRHLARAMGAFLAAAPLGGGVSLLLGGAMLDWMSHAGLRSAIGLGGLAPWQATYVLVGVPGIALALLLYFTTKEPGRYEIGGVRGRAGAAATQSNWPLYYATFGTGVFVALLGFALHGWLPAFVGRAYGWSAATSGLYLGLVTLVVTPAGTFVGGLLCERLQDRGVTDAPARILRYCFLSVIPIAALAFLQRSVGVSILAIAAIGFVYAMQVPLCPLALQLTAPESLIGRTSALYVAIANLLGVSAGPLVVGALSDVLGTHAIGQSLFVNSVIAAVGGVTTTILMYRFWMRRGLVPAPSGSVCPPAMR